MDRRGKPSSYVLKLEMLLLVLRSHQHTCTLSTEVPVESIVAAGSPLDQRRFPPSCQATLSVVQGEVHSCLIHDRQSGQMLLEGRSAFAHLQQCDELSWDVLPPQPAASSLPISPTDKRDSDHESRTWPPPQRATRFQQSQIDALPRRHRQVFNLVDGQRGINELCHMLAGSPEQLIAILDELSTKDLIVMPHGRSEERT